MHGGRFVTLRAERRSAPCCAVDSREVSSRQQGAEWRLAGKVLRGSPLPKGWRFTSQGRAVYLLLVISLLTGNYDFTQSLGFPLYKGKVEGLVLS